MRFVIVVGSLVLLASCTKKPKPAIIVPGSQASSTQKVSVARSAPHPADANSAPNPSNGVEMTVRQRSTTDVPGTNGKLRLTIDDITRNQVMVTLMSQDGKPILGPTSLQQGGEVRFPFDGATWRLELKRLNNVLIGDDDATLFIVKQEGATEAKARAAVGKNTKRTPKPRSKLTERERVEKLMEVVAALTDARFLRNGEEHSATDAAEHLRRKWQLQSRQIATAEDFIEKVASVSSTTGAAYQIRFPDGKTVPAREFLLQELRKLDEVHAPATP